MKLLQLGFSIGPQQIENDSIKARTRITHHTYV